VTTVDFSFLLSFVKIKLEYKMIECFNMLCKIFFTAEYVFSSLQG